jgi:hypothetical protein
MYGAQPPSSHQPWPHHHTIAESHNHSITASQGHSITQSQRHRATASPARTGREAAAAAAQAACEPLRARPACTVQPQVVPQLRVAGGRPQHPRLIQLAEEHLTQLVLRQGGPRPPLPQRAGLVEAQHAAQQEAVALLEDQLLRGGGS